MRIRRLAVLSGLTAAIGGLVWWMKSREPTGIDDETMLLDLAARDQGSSDHREPEASQMAR